MNQLTRSQKRRVMYVENKSGAMRVFLAAVLIVLAGLGVIYIGFAERIDGEGVIIDIGGYVYDPVGYVDQAVNKVVRDCSEVEKVNPSSQEGEAVKAHLRTYMRAGEPTLAMLMKTRSWLIAESEFSAADPAVVLLHAQDGGYKTESVWGGSSAPFKAAPVVREYFRSQVPAVPSSLVRCYEPITPPFDS